MRAMFAQLGDFSPVVGTAHWDRPSFIGGGAPQFAHGLRAELGASTKIRPELQWHHLFIPPAKIRHASMARPDALVRTLRSCTNGSASGTNTAMCCWSHSAFSCLLQLDQKEH